MDKKNKNRWAIPSKRAENYAAERKNKVHNRGSKEGKPLTDYESGLRSGYLQCQNDHASFFKYKEARKAGKTKEQARKAAQEKWKKEA